MGSQKLIVENMLSKCIDSMQEYKDMLDQHAQPEDEVNSEFAEIVKSFSIVDFHAQAVAKVADLMTQHYDDAETIDVDHDFDEEFNKRVKKIKKTLAESQVWHRVFGDPTRNVMAVENREEEINENDYEQVGDGSILCTSVFKPPIDPISKNVIKNPYKSRICGHVYEYVYIVSYINKMKEKAKCPYMGCNNVHLTVGQLIEDAALKVTIEEYIEAHQNDSD